MNFGNETNDICFNHNYIPLTTYSLVFVLVYITQLHDAHFALDLFTG